LYYGRTILCARFPREERHWNTSSRSFPASWSIEPLNDRFGSALDAEFDALVVSEETLPIAREINRIRHEKGRQKVDIHQITCVLADDGHWISSTRIYRGEIDIHGRLLG